MTNRRWSRRAALLSGAGAGLLALSAAFAYATDVALIMGGTEDPTPDQTYLTDVYNDYIAPHFPGYTPTALTTPEQFFPLPGFSELTFGQSVVQGLGDLQTAIAQQLADGNDVAVFGYSQSATIATDELDQIANGTVTNPPSPAELGFVLVGDPNDPDGGLLERFDGFYVPGFNIPFNGATPDLDYPTDIYTIQYDGYADFPQYPLNILADINAGLGILYDHPNYPTLTPPIDAITEPVSSGAVGDTTYYLIPTQTLPLLEPLVQAGAPQAAVDFLTPDLRVLVDLGYGNIGGAVDPDYANLPTPASLVELINPATVLYDLGKGFVQGIEAAAVDDGQLPASDYPDTYPFVPSLDPGLSINMGQPDMTLLSGLAGGLGTVLYALHIPDFANGTSDAGDFITDTAGSGILGLSNLFG